MGPEENSVLRVMSGRQLSRILCVCLLRHPALPSNSLSSAVVFLGHLHLEMVG